MAKTFSSFGKPSVLLLAELDDFSFSLCRKLIDRSCKIFLITKKDRTWKRVLPVLGGHENFQIVNRDDIKKIQRVDYVILHYNLFKALTRSVTKARKEIKNDFLHLLERTSYFRAKYLFLLPNINGILPSALTPVGKIIYFSETFGPEMVLVKDAFVFSAFEAALLKKRLLLPKKEENLRPIFSNTISEKVIEILFSFSYPHEVTLVGETISSRAFVEKLKIDNVEIDQRKRNYRSYVPRSNTKQISLGPTVGVDETLEFLRKKHSSSPKTKKGTYFSRFIIFLLLTLLIPFIFLLLSLGALGASYLFLKNGDISLAKYTLSVSRSTSGVSNAGFGTFSDLPLVGDSFGFFTTSSKVIGRSVNLFESAVFITENGEPILTGILGEEPFNISSYSEKISTEIDYVYKESGFILGEIGSEPTLAKFLEKTEVFQELSTKRQKLVPLSRLLKNLPDILAEEGRKKYLVLLQNNMELRPTGGFIGSFSLVSFEGGRLTNFEIWDVFEADGQLKGHVEPPSPIKFYLDEANWFLRDSNWDPDFGVSAARAEWFLDKEINEKVDGVVGIDLEFIKDLLAVSGPISLSDFDIEINKDNFYEVTQKEVEEDFFPGSTKKSNFLTALSRALIEEVKEVDGRNNVALAKGVFKNLEERHIQIFAHERPVSNALSEVGWDGRISATGSCGDNCYSDLLGVVEANVGVNKANLFVGRSISGAVVFEEGKIKRELTLLLNNSSDKNLGRKGIYKVYVRALAPGDATFQKVKIIQNGTVVETEPEIRIVRDFQEAGTIASVDPQSSATFIFAWESPRSFTSKNPGEYSFLLRKQAGTDADPINLSVNSLVESLTPEGGFVYNTFLTRDFVSRISW